MARVLESSEVVFDFGCRSPALNLQVNTIGSGGAGCSELGANIGRASAPKHSIHNRKKVRCSLAGLRLGQVHLENPPQKIPNGCLPSWEHVYLACVGFRSDVRVERRGWGASLEALSIRMPQTRIRPGSKVPLQGAFRILRNYFHTLGRRPSTKFLKESLGIPAGGSSGESARTSFGIGISSSDGRLWGGDGSGLRDLLVCISVSAVALSHLLCCYSSRVAGGQDNNCGRGGARRPW